MKIEVVYASKIKQHLQEIELPENSSIQEAIEASSLLEEFPEINLNETTVGIFGKKCSLSSFVRAGDRIEIYRPLTIHPMQKRRRLAEIQKKRVK
jgi:putative ubiquitin-RnfH superfamily antitoxin RatB of RatAB toxin-antitoxin module